MKFAIDNISVHDLDRGDIEDEFSILVDIRDLTPEQENYYAHRGHRVHMSFDFSDGSAPVLAPTAETLAALRVIEAEVNAAIEASSAGVTATAGWVFSPYAGCGGCPCSPGFLVDGTGTEKRVFVKATVSM